MFKRFWWVFLVMLPVGAVGGLLVMAVVTYVMPKKYESEAVIEVRRMTSPSEDGAVPSQTTPQYFFGTEFNKIKSRASLAEVVEKLELTNQWGVDQDAAIRILKEIVITENLRGTDLIAIRVRHTDREATRDIAAEVARVYRDYRVGIIKRDSDRRLAELNKAIKEQEEKVEERRKILGTIAGKGSLLAGPDTLRDQDMIDAKRDLETDQALLQSMKLKQISATIEGEMQNESVIIHEEPQVSHVPVSPNVTLNLILGAVGGFLISPLLALPVMLLLHRLNPVKANAPPVQP